MKNKYSIFSLVKNAFSYHENWQKAWKDPVPKKEYDAIIIGGGGHGLATAYYLAKKHNMKNIAVVEKGWIGGGNTGRNTTIIRSNYLWDASAGLYDHALKLWEGLSQEARGGFGKAGDGAQDGDFGGDDSKEASRTSGGRGPDLGGLH